MKSLTIRTARRRHGDVLEVVEDSRPGRRAALGELLRELGVEFRRTPAHYRITVEPLGLFRTPARGAARSLLEEVFDLGVRHGRRHQQT